uniref:Uncharacterized protein n=1 Tax=Arundo donax TaxID=35708 RepID=A0A0A9GEI0_ARUDO
MELDDALSFLRRSSSSSSWRAEPAL